MTTALTHIGSEVASEHASGDADHSYGDFAQNGSLKYLQVWHHLDGGTGLRSIYGRLYRPVFDEREDGPREPVAYLGGRPFLIAQAGHADYNGGSNECKRPEVLGMLDGSFVVSYVRRKTTGTIHDANSCQIEVKRVDGRSGSLSHAGTALGFVVDNTVTFGVSEGFQRMVAEPDHRFTICWIHEVSYNDSGANNTRTFDLRMRTLQWLPENAASNPTEHIAQSTVVSAFPIDDSDAQPWALNSAAVGLHDMAIAANGDYHVVYERADGAAAADSRTRIEYRRFASSVHTTPYTLLESAAFSNETAPGGGTLDRPQRRPRIASLHPFVWGKVERDRIAQVQGDQFVATPEDSTYLFRNIVTRNNDTAQNGATLIAAVANSQLDADNELTQRPECFLRPDEKAVSIQSLSNEGGGVGSTMRMHDEDGDTYWLPGAFISTTRSNPRIARSYADKYVLAVPHEGVNNDGDDTKVGISFFTG